MGRADGIDAAMRQAELAVGTFRHGAVVLVGKRVVARGHNHVRGAASAGVPSIHAEMDALWKLRDPPPSGQLRLVVVRLSKSGRLANSRPCAMCMNVLQRRGVHTVVYSTDQPEVAGVEVISRSTSTPSSAPSEHRGP